MAIPYNTNRTFRAGLPGVNIRSNFPNVAPGVYGPKNPSPFGFSLPTGYQLPQITPFTTTPITADDSNQTDRLPLGAPVDGAPGLYESNETKPVGNPGQPAAPSRYTMREAPPGTPELRGGTRTNDPAYQQTAMNGTLAALQQIYNAPSAFAGGGGASATRSGAPSYNPMSEFGPTAGTLQAAAGLEAERVAYAARGVLGRPSNRNYNARTGEMLDQSSNSPVGSPLMSDVVVSPFDPPEVRASKQAFWDKKIRELAAKDPALAGSGDVPSTQTMANVFQRLMAEAGQPRYRNLGKDSEGRPVEGTVDRNGNFSRITPEKDKEKIRTAEPEFSRDGKFYRSGPDDEWKPAPNTADKPLNVTEWLMSGRPEGTYANYRAAVKRESKGAGLDNEQPVAPVAPVVPAATPAPAAPAAAGGNVQPNQPAPVIYNHNDVLRELERRGIKR